MRRQAPKPCTRPAGWGTDHPGTGACKLHGGKTRTHVVAAQRVAAEKARDTYGLPIDVPAEVALLQELSRTAGHVAWLFEQVRATAPEALVWGKTEEVDRGASEFPGVDVKRAASPNAFLELYIRERKHLLDVAKTVAGLGLAERQVRLAESQGEAMFGVFSRVLGALGLTSEQQALVPELLRREIGSLTAGPGGKRVIEGRL